MKRRLVNLAVFVCAALLVATISFGFALLGEPSAVWLWRDMAGLL